MNKDKKLFVSCATLGSGGAERVLSILSTPFADEYERVIYLLWLHHPQFYKIDERVEIVDITQKAQSNNILKKMVWFRRFVKAEKPDLILSFLYPWSMKVVLSLLFTPFKIVVAERQDPKLVKGGRLIMWLRELLYRRASEIVVQTQENRGRYNGDVSTIYNPTSVAGEWVGKALKTEKENIIVSVGRLITQKNQAMLLNAFALFHKQHPEVALIIYGEGELRNSLLEQSKELGILEYVQLPGNTPDVLGHIVKAKAFVLPSKFEGMPNALLEAMCVGLPCVSTKVSGATEMIHDGENGLLVDLDDVEQMSAALCWLFDNPENARKMGERASSIFDLTKPDVIFGQWIEMINKNIEK